MTSPILSICIPTYNRASALRISLSHIMADVSLMRDGDVEVIVADNNSIDETKNVCLEFERRYPGNFIYHRQDKNIGYSGNIKTLMEIAHGEFIKFQNDNFYFLPGQLNSVVVFVLSNMQNRPVLFFGNDTIQCQNPGIFHANTFDEMLDAVSFATTWTGGFGFWREDKPTSIAVHDKTAWTLISQTAILWALFDIHRSCAVYNYKIFSDENAWSVSRGGYNISEVQGRNYLEIIKEYVRQGKISHSAYEHEKKRLYKGFIFVRYFDFAHKFNYNKGNFYRNMVEYHRNVYFWLSFLQWPFFKAVSLLPKHMMAIPMSLYGRWKRVRMKHW